jgi:hypothetical protein
MATHRGEVATLIANGTGADVTDLGGRVRLSYDVFRASGNLSDGDIIIMGKLPQGARVVDYVLKHGDFGATGTCTVGWLPSEDGLEAGDSDGLFTSVDLHTAAAIQLASGSLTVPGLFRKFQSGVELAISLTADTTAAADMELVVLYTID